MNMNAFYRRILDFEEVVAHRVSQAVIENTAEVDRETVTNTVNKVRSEVKLVYLDMISSLQNLEASQPKPAPKKNTRKRK